MVVGLDQIGVLGAGRDRTRQPRSRSVPSCPSARRGKFFPLGRIVYQFRSPLANIDAGLQRRLFRGLRLFTAASFGSTGKKE